MDRTRRAELKVSIYIMCPCIEDKFGNIPTGMLPRASYRSYLVYSSLIYQDTSRLPYGM